MDLSIGSVLERLVLKKYAECTSQRLKWTSGARVMIWSRSKVEVKGQGTLRRVLVARFADLPGQNTFPGFEIFPVARLSEFPGFVVFPGSIFPVVSRFLASGQCPMAIEHIMWP